MAFAEHALAELEVQHDALSRIDVQIVRSDPQFGEVRTYNDIYLYFGAKPEYGDRALRLRLFLMASEKGTVIGMLRSLANALETDAEVVIEGPGEVVDVD